MDLRGIESGAIVSCLLHLQGGIRVLAGGCFRRLQRKILLEGVKNRLLRMKPERLALSCFHAFCISSGSCGELPATLCRLKLRSVKQVAGKSRDRTVGGERMSRIIAFCVLAYLAINCWSPSQRLCKQFEREVSSVYQRSTGQLKRRIAGIARYGNM